MKNLYFLIVVFFITFSTVMAEDLNGTDISFDVSNGNIFDSESIPATKAEGSFLKFASCYVMGFVGHEAAHQKQATEQNLGMSWKWEGGSGPKWTLQSSNKSKLAIVAGAGLRYQFNSANKILAEANINDTCANGILAFDILNAIAYATAKGSGSGDVGDVEQIANGHSGYEKYIRTIMTVGALDVAFKAYQKRQGVKPNLDYSIGPIAGTDVRGISYSKTF